LEIDTVKRAGILDTRISIQRRTTGQSSSGEQTEVWSDLATRWAQVRPLTGTERLTGENLTAKEQIQFKIRFDDSIADLSPLDRIIMPPTASPTDKQIYNIIQASEAERRDWFLILAYRFANAG
jgi:SPP1 family predicted phage head-tail adaptor